MAAHDSTTTTGTGSITNPAAAPRRRHYSSGAASTPLHELPFVARRPNGERGWNGWNVPPTDDYAHACKMGTEYAGHLVQYLKDNPYWVGSNVLSEIVSAMDFSDESGAKGYRVGFFAHLERVLYAQAIRADVFAGVDTVLAEYAAGEERARLDASPLFREAP